MLILSFANRADDDITQECNLNNNKIKFHAQKKCAHKQK